MIKTFETEIGEGYRGKIYGGEKLQLVYDLTMTPLNIKNVNCSYFIIDSIGQKIQKIYS